MANLAPKKIDLQSINGGQRYGYEAVSPDAINAPIEASAYAQALATNPPDVSQISGVGFPSVTIEETEKGTPRLSFKHLKGEKGDSGLSYGASLSNEYGDSDVNGYTQRAINAMVAKPNILINGDFRVNQRGFMSYTEGYSVDRWYVLGCQVSPTDKGLSMLKVRADASGICQPIDRFDFLLGKTVTMSAKISDASIGYGVAMTIGVASVEDMDDTVGRVDISSNSIVLDANLPSQIVTVTATLPNTIPYSKLICYVDFENASGGDEVTVEWVKLEISDYPTEYIYEPYEVELAKCQRYYKRIEIYSGDRAPFATGFVYGAVSAYVIVPSVQLRTPPTLIYEGAFRIFTSSGYKEISKISIDETLSDNLALKISGADFPSNAPCFLSAYNDEGAFLAFDAEIY